LPSFSNTVWAKMGCIEKMGKKVNRKCFILVGFGKDRACPVFTLSDFY
jgi:hypothetical protein